MERVRVLVLGATGQVGGQLVAHLGHIPTVEVVEAARSSERPHLAFRLEDRESVDRVIEQVRPRHTFLVAAATNVAWCEAHPAESRAINVDGTRAAATACVGVGSSLTFVSTDYVFDGSTAPAGEGDDVHPLNEYGRQKLDAERTILAHPGNLVVRASQVFGADGRRANFVMRSIDRLRAGEVVLAPEDMYGTPTYAVDLARILVDLTLAGESGVWHAAGESFLSRYELVTAAAAAFGIANPTIQKVSAEMLDDGVPRPLRSGLRNDRLRAEGRQHMTPLMHALDELAAWDAQQ